MKKLLKEVLFLAAGMMLCFTSCSNGSDDPALPNPNVNGNGSGLINASAGLKFDFSGAKALAAVDAGALTQGADGESTADSPLIKFLEDGSAVAAVTKTGSGNLSKIKKIYKSPVASSKDVFVVFEGQSWFNDNGKSYPLGTLVCVHEDGSIADILKKTDSSDNRVTGYYSLDSSKDIKFDGAGNAYFMTKEYSSGSDTSLICKFNPSDNSLTQLTAGVEGISYGKFMITSDGQLILVSGYRSPSTYFLRAIPVSDPNHFTNIYYSSSSSSVQWEYDDVNGICYFSADVLSRSVRNGNTFFEAEKLDADVKWYYSQLIEEKNNNQNTTYVWKDMFLKSDGSVNSKLVLQYMFNRCWTSGQKEFRLDYFKNHQDYSLLYSDLKDEDAIIYISSDVEKMKLFKQYIESSWTDNMGYSNSLENIIFKKGTSVSAFRENTENDKYVNHSWGYDKDYFTNSEGLWKSFTYSNNGNNAFYLVHITDASGTPIWEAKKINLPNGKMVSSQQYNGNIYMSYALLTSSGAETGFHQIYSVNLDTGDYKNLFQNVPNNSMLEVISYSVGSDLLYYSAVRGTAVENGVVNVTSGEYNPLTIKKKLTAIYTF